MLPYLLPIVLLTATALPAALPADEPPEAEPAGEVKPLAEASEREKAVAMLTEAIQSEDNAQLRDVARKVADLLGDDWRASTRLKRAVDASDDVSMREAVVVEKNRLGFKPIMEADTPPDWPTYTVVGETELKQYPAYRVAVARSGEKREADSRLFFTLFNHIKDRDIPMTTPVEMTGQADESAGETMGFLYPDSETGQTGSAGDVEVVDVPAMTVVSIGMLGRDFRDNIDQTQAILDNWVKAHPEWKPAGALRVLGYNSPMVPSFMSYSEVQIPLTRAN